MDSHRSGCLPSARQSGLCCRARVMTGTRTAREQGLSWPSFSRIHNSLGRLGRIAIYYTLGRLGSGFASKKLRRSKNEKPTVRGLIMRNWTGRDCPPLSPPLATKPARYEPFLLSL